MSPSKLWCWILMANVKELKYDQAIMTSRPQMGSKFLKRVYVQLRQFNLQFLCCTKHCIYPFLSFCLPPCEDVVSTHSPDVHTLILDVPVYRTMEEYVFFSLKIIPDWHFLLFQCKWTKTSPKFFLFMSINTKSLLRNNFFLFFMKVF